ncbi:hypothetical protein C3K47_10940 [Solitalea longa]|uniref:Uncharacterized protein n=1 Tax=Solitalea longa TaxID=2079460 RepID=A0A2S5A2D2_9SPHI|nr:hypothetical protein [Solitalea longa]POY36263.1 hypothetical protein C3K47_10940 [Solitalea longa]
MAEQKGIIKFKGSIGDISFYKSKDGYMARERGGIDASRIANDPKFQRTRENGAEFGRAGKAGKLLRSALRTVVYQGADSRMTARLMRDMMKVIKADAVNDRGQRQVMDGEVELLTGFEFNEQGKVSTTVFMPYTPAIDRATGQLTVSIPAFVPNQTIAAPTGTTHFTLKVAGALVDFEAENYVVDVKDTGMLALDNTATTIQPLVCAVTPASTKPLFIALGIEFYQQINSKFYLLSNGAFNGLALVNISGQ